MPVWIMAYSYVRRCYGVSSTVLVSLSQQLFGGTVVSFRTLYLTQSYRRRLGISFFITNFSRPRKTPNLTKTTQT